MSPIRSHEKGIVAGRSFYFLRGGGVGKFQLFQMDGSFDEPGKVGKVGGWVSCVVDEPWRSYN